MTKRRFIDKKEVSPYHIDIRQLYQEGLKLIQNYAGSIWTDYNEHDPGVTILENLVFAITDLCYRMGFETLDYLVEEDGYIDTEKRALYDAHEILSTHPITLQDYRKVIFDKIQDVSNVWIEPANNYKIDGLYKVYLFLKPSKHFSIHHEEKEQLEAYESSIRKEVFDLWPKIRNIGEDLNKNDVIILKKQEVFIEANIIVRSSNALEDILAEIILRIDRYLNPEMVMSSLEEMTSAGYEYDEIFEGPQLDHGFIREEVLLEERPQKVTKSNVLAILSDIEGIMQIENLRLVYEKDGKKTSSEVMEIEEGFIPRFRFERLASKSHHDDGDQMIKRNFDNSRDGILCLKMRRKNTTKYLPLNYDHVLKTLQRKQALLNRVYAIKGDNHRKPVSSKGTSRNWAEYYSIQNHFPTIYGINQSGLSSFESEQRKVQALQLKGYLLIFEQLIANFQSQIAHLKDLYSVDPDHFDLSYYFQPLLDAQINDIEKLYSQSSSDSENEILATTVQRVLGKLNEIYPHEDRKSRLFDYMLSLYGERFTQNTLKRVNQDFEGREQMTIIENKVKMLKLLRYFNTNSAKAPSYPNKNLQDMSGFELKLSVLLGLDSLPKKEHDRKQKPIVFEGYKAIRTSDPDWTHRLSVKPELVNKIIKSENLFRATSLAKGVPTPKLPDRTFYISKKFLNLGFLPTRYYIYTSENSDTYFLLLKESDHSWYLLDKQPTLEKIIRVYQIALDICYTFSDENYNSDNGEQFYIVDHVMLRPKQGSIYDPIDKSEIPSFYSFNVSIIFPNWGDRFGDDAFRQLAEETVIKNVSAHMISNILWLDPFEYAEFIRLFIAYHKESHSDMDRKRLVSFLSSRIMTSMTS